MTLFLFKLNPNPSPLPFFWINQKLLDFFSEFLFSPPQKVANGEKNATKCGLLTVLLEMVWSELRC